jgi:hypothetical protein
MDILFTKQNVTTKKEARLRDRAPIIRINLSQRILNIL